MSDPNTIIKEAVKDARHTLKEYVSLLRDCEDTVQKLFSTLDKDDVARRS